MKYMKADPPSARGRIERPTMAFERFADQLRVDMINVMATPPAHLRVSLTLIPSERGGRKSPLPGGETRTVLAVSGMHFPAILNASKSVQPGGSAIDCGVKFLIPHEACPNFPAGTRFELWEDGRKGYGVVLEAYSAE